MILVCLDENHGTGYYCGQPRSPSATCSVYLDEEYPAFMRYSCFFLFQQNCCFIDPVILTAGSLQALIFDQSSRVAEFMRDTSIQRFSSHAVATTSAGEVSAVCPGYRRIVVRRKSELEYTADHGHHVSPPAGDSVVHVVKAGVTARYSSTRLAQYCFMRYQRVVDRKC